MKKAKIIGKKTLSVFLAVLMVLTAWVWVAPTEASAVNSSGNYTWRLYINCTNAYTGNAGYYTVTGKTNNGQGTDTTISNQTTLAVGSNSIFDKGTSAYFPSSDGTTTTAFPYKVYIHTYKNSGFDFWPGMTDGSYSAELQVKDSSGSWKTICSGDSGVTNGHGNVDLTISHATNNYPSPNSIKWETENAADTADLTIGKTANVTRTMKFNVYDQYGVRMSSAALTALNKAPTATVTASQSGTLGTNTSSNIYYTLSSTNTDAYYITVTAKPGAKSTTYDSQTITISASCNSKSLTNRTFTLYDPMYKFTMNPNGGGMISPTTDIEKRYHNTFGYTPNASRTGFTLIGFYTTDYDDSYEDSEVSSSDSKLTSTTYIDGDLTWYAAWQANQYKIKFTYRDENGSWITTDEVTEYFGRDIPFPEVKSVIETVDHTYTFTGWSPAHTTVQAVDGVTEYTAVYSDVTHYADLTALEEQIRLANEKKAEQLYTEGAYTDSTVEIFEDTLELAENLVGRKPLLSEQSTVNGLANTLKTARENLDIKNYTVIFVDEDGTILKDGYFFVPHGSSVTIPANPDKEADETNHYAFDFWDREESDSLDACNYVTANLIYVAAFAAEAHSFTETVTPSTCTEDGIITKTCDCGFSYTVAGDTAGHKWSTDYKELVPATCATKGAEAKYCTACGAIDESTKREIAALGHNFGGYTEFVPATCFSEGTEISICTRCDGRNVRKTNKLIHQFGAAVVVPKTCTTDGYTKEVCNNCGFTNIRDIDIAKGHSLKFETSAETCVSSGYAKTFCENCDFEKTTVYPATGVHTFIDNWTTVSEASCVGHGVEKRVCTVCGAATETRLTALANHTEPAEWTTEVEPWCDSTGRKVKDCTVCGKELKSETIAALNHNYEAYAEGSYAPTCTTAGAEAEKCSRCGDINTTVIQPTGHKYENAGAIVETAATCTSSAFKTYNCDNCDYTYKEIINGSNALLHDFTGTETIISDATCTADGKKTVKCTRCDAVNEVIIPKLGHSYGAWVVEKEATNNEDGKWTRTCSKCNDVEEITIPKGGHEWDNGAVTKAATCKETGTMLYKCNAHENCGITLEVTIPVTQHSVAQRETPATCTKTGTVEAYCTVCNQVLSTEEIPVVPHTLNNGTAVAPNCTTSGYTLYKCTAENCDFSYKAYDENQPANGHNYVGEVTKAADCTNEGEMTYICSVCSKSYTEEIPATGHSYGAGTVVQEQTCTDVEKTEYACNCGDRYTVITKEAKGHTFGNWEVVTPATSDKHGVKKGTCACGATEYDVIPPIGNHTFTETITKNPTCTEKGEKSFTCSAHTDCSANYTAEIPALGHTQKIVYTAPTCIASGSSKIVCETCDETIKTETIPAIGYHNFSGEGTVTAEPTCTGTGTMTYTCLTDGCNATKTETIHAKGHSLSTTVNHPTCGVAGSVVTECANCNDPAVEKTVELAAKGHIWETTSTETKEADCETDGSETYKCQNCDETNVVVIPKLGHNWSDWTVIPSTNNDKGSVSRKCLRDGCNATESVDIPAGGHILTETARTNSTCVTPGSVTYTCTVAHENGACGISVEVALPLAQHTITTLEQEATCTADGFIKKYCSVDGCSYVVVNEVRKKIAHVYTAGNSVDATCTTSGYTPYTCSCGDTYNKYDEDKPANGHNFTGDETIITPATCTTDGSKTVKCADCDVKNPVVIPKTGHNYTEDTSAATDATCTALATKTYKCACGASYVKHEGTLAAHQFNTLVKTVPATNESLGYEERKCVCGLTEITIIEATGTHVFDEKIENECIAPTCTENGTDVYKCTAHTDCGVKSSVLVPRLGHSGKAEYIAPTCIAAGSSKVVCETCKNTLDSVVIPAKGHAYNTVEVTTEPGCENPGERTCSCSCGDSYTEEIPAKGHAFSTTVTDATCYKKGSVVTVCTVCNSDTVKTTKELPMIEHTWNDGEIKEGDAATCEKDGKKTFACTVENCGATKTETIAKLGHDWSDWTVIPSTNDNPGSVSRTCLRGCTESVVIPKGDHNLVVDTDKSTDASCSAEGKLVYKCDKHDDCGITVTVTIDKIQHNLENVLSDATCEGTGSVVTRCKECNATLITTIIPAKGHTVTVTTTPATCTTDGSVVEKCNNCTHEETVATIPALGHSFSGKVTEEPATCLEEGKRIIECIRCDETTEFSLPALGHDFTGEETTVENATCTEDGEKTVKCKNCQETTTVVIPKLGHSYGEWIKTDATNDTPGEWKRTCSRCNDVQTLEIPAGGHNLVEDVDAYKAPTCIAKGQQVYKCTNHTDCSVKVIVELDFAQHTVAQKINEATCTAKGSVVAYCSVEGCGKEFSTKEIPVKPHSYVAQDAVAPTCTTSGYTPYECSCGDTYNVYDATKPATGHTLVEGTSTANCTAGGQMTLTCSKCNNYSTKVDVPALGHNYVEDITAATEATCAAAATKTFECSRCADSYTISVGDKATEHSWNDWVTVESATNTSLGYKTRTCKVCGKMEVETIAATGEHKFDVLVSEKAADCENAGEKVYSCSTHTGDNACKLTSTVTLPALGHTKTIEYKAASCTEAGYTKIVCSVEGCDYEANKTVIPALGHLYGEGTVTPSTCETKGEIEYACTRQDCNETKTVEIATNANAHQYNTTIVDATCTTPGSVVTKCSLCDKETTNKTLPMIEHSWNSGTETTKATCTTDGTKTYTCTADGCTETKTETIAKLGHNWGEWTVTKASTNTEKGTLTRECTRGCEETAEIPAGGHNLVVDTENSTAATCTKEGSVTYICDTEHTGGVDCGITVTVTLDKIQHEFETTKKDATCEGTGTVVTKCKNCDTATITTTIPATGHTYDDGVKTDATCTQTGKIVYTCTAKDCGETKEVILDMLQHEYKAGTSVAPTCTSSGYTPYKCENCESSYVILVAPAKGHSFTEKVSSTATCTEGGNLTLKCADCDKTMETAVPALGHNYELKSKTTATCAAGGTETYECSACKDTYIEVVSSKLTNYEAHDWNNWVTVEATNTSLGYKTRTCKICEKLELEIIQATGEHKFTIRIDAESKAPTCTEDGYDVFQCSVHENCTEKSRVDLPKLGHTEELRYTAATCTSKGSTSIYCDVCKETLTSREIPALEHVWGSEEITQPTCSSKGSIKFTCTSCNTETKTVEIPENTDAHKLTTSTEKAATCKEEGLLVTTCALCDYRTETTLPMLQHSWGNWIVKASTNNAVGSVSRTCSNGCTESVEIPVGGHNFGNTPDSVVAATCTTTGTATYNCIAHTGENACGVTITVTLEKVQHALVTESETATCEKGGFVKVYCSNCDYKSVDMTIGKLAHNDEVIETVPATCETAGYTTFKCKDCGRGFSRLDAQPTGHKYVKDGAIVTTPATCETAGYTTYNCDNCDETHVVDIAAAKGHDWTEWSVTKAATNTEPGELSRTCKNGCGKTETAEIPAGGHTFDTKNPVSTTQGTCETKGTKTFKCTAHTNCGIEITVETEFGAHAWSDWTKVDATNDEDGYWTRKCATCEEEETLVIPAGNHNLVEDTTKYVAPECNKQGQRVYRCTAHTNCSVTITVVLEKIQHTPKTDKQDASCTENGYVKTYCEKCGEVLSNVELTATGHVNTTIERKESTCIEKGYEKVICACGYVVSEKELPLVAHNYDVTYENGVYTYTCKQAGCGHSYTETVDISFTVRFFAADKSTVIKTETVIMNGAATAPEAPAKAPDGTYHYTFSEWDRNFAVITSDLDVYPIYEKEAHFGGEATCTEKALCEKCNAPYGETDETKHIMATKATPATCETDGKIEHYCTEEGCVYGYTEAVNKLGHNYGAWETYQNGNCATPYISIRKCKNYGCKMYEQKESYGSHTWYIQPEIAPTCTTVGYSAYKYCTTCGLEVDSVVIPKLDHRDNNGDGVCDYCAHTDAPPICNCMCHSTGFMKFIYSIVRFFWMITRSTPSCSCGARHY